MKFWIQVYQVLVRSNCKYQREKNPVVMLLSFLRLAKISLYEPLLTLTPVSNFIVTMMR